MNTEVVDGEGDYAVHQYSVAGLRGEVDGVNYEGAVRRHVKNESPVALIRERLPGGGDEVIAVYVERKRWFFSAVKRHKIGYLNQRMANALCNRLDAGGQIVEAHIRSFFVPIESDGERRDHSYIGWFDDPVRVSIIVTGNWVESRRERKPPQEQWLPGPPH